MLLIGLLTKMVIPYITRLRTLLRQPAKKRGFKSRKRGCESSQFNSPIKDWLPHHLRIRNIGILFLLFGGIVKRGVVFCRHYMPTCQGYC